MASSILAAGPPEEVVMFRFWKEESEDAQEAAAAGSQLRGEIDAPESDGGLPRAVEADEVDLDESPSVLSRRGRMSHRRCSRAMMVSL